NPMLWYEWHRKRPGPSARIVWAVYGVLALGGVALMLYEWAQGTGPPLLGALLTAQWLPGVGLLLVGVGAVTALTEERVRGTLDVLLATPLPTRAIVGAKWRSAFRSALGVAALPLVLAGVLACQGGGWDYAALFAGLLAAYGAFLTSLGLALATW